MTDFPGLHHVALTVADLERSAAWYEKLFGAAPAVNENAGHFWHIVWALPNGSLFGIHGHDATDTSERFSEFRIGLDHVSFGVPSRADLEKWANRLDELGIVHGDIVDAPYGSGVSFRDPDNNALEFFAPPGS